MWFDNIVKPIIALAPMADLTDQPFCRICREVSDKDFVIFREMASAEAIVRGNAKTMKMCEFSEMERPIVMQIFGGNPETMAESAKIIMEKFSPDGIDINMGCPVPKIAVKSKAGASLMKDHERAVAIVKAIKNLNLGVAISVKTRLGWNKEDEILAFAPKLEKAGVDLLTIHGRTKTQGYSGKANWEMIGEVKKIVSIPVIANGDIESAEDILRCLKITGADGVMIGRGALGKPWVFLKSKISRSERDPDSLSGQNPNLIDVVIRHAQYHVERYGEKSMVTFRKHLLCYFKGYSRNLKNELVKVSTIAELNDILSNKKALS